MPAEMVRDNALAASGLLVNTVGGPSRIPYQPDTIWDGLAVYTVPGGRQDPADDHHRRSLYSFIKRNAPHPAMATFDLPDRGTTTRQAADVEYAAAGAGAARRSTVSRGLPRPGDARAEDGCRSRRADHHGLPAGDTTAADCRRSAVRCALTSTRSWSGTGDRTRRAKLVKAGVTPVDPQVDVAQLAALMNLTAVVMNTPDAYSLR